jgi:hypothetical protein
MESDFMAVALMQQNISNGYSSFLAESGIGEPGMASIP